MSVSDEGRRKYNETRRILREARANHRLVLFVGSGASIDPGMPSWRQAVSNIASKLPLLDGQCDLMKVPQFYYNSRGKKEYTQLMRDIFLYGIPLKTTDLHKKIIDCQVDTIITTNYDHLIEQASEENSEVRYVISKDGDLPYKNITRELIKMHGDFENDNFVLKEDDYLSYSNNFKLIETYIKSLIGSKIVLFVGYSLSDPDVKQIFSWVKDALKDDFQRSYLLLSGEEANEIERDYYKNIGVNLIYTSELLDNWNQLSRTEQLVKFFDYILKDEDKSAIHRLYEELAPFQSLNYVYGKYVKNALFKCDLQCQSNCIDLSIDVTDAEDVKRLKTILWDYITGKDMSKDDCVDDLMIEKLKLIAKVLSNSVFTCITNGNETHYITDVSDGRSVLIDKAIRDFNYHELYDLSVSGVAESSSDTPHIHIEQAFLHSLLGNYYAAYNAFKNASKLFYGAKRYEWYYIAEVNRKYNGKLCLSPINRLFISKDERVRIENEIEAIDLDRLLVTIPNADDNRYHFLKDLSGLAIAYRLFSDAYSTSKKVSEQAKTKYLFFSEIPAYEVLKDDVCDYDRYMTRNYLALSEYIEIKSIFHVYVKNILSSVLIMKGHNETASDGVFTSNVIKKDELDDFDIYTILRYLSYSDLRGMANELSIKLLPCSEEALRYLGSVMINIFESEDYIKSRTKSSGFIYTYLEVLSLIEMPEKLAENVLNTFAKNLSMEHLRNSNASINRIVFNLCKDKYYSNDGVASAALKLIDSLLDILSKNFDMYQTFDSLIRNLTFFCEKNGKPYDNVAKSKMIIDVDDKEFRVSAHTHLGPDSKNLIKGSFASWKPGKSADDYCLYCDAVLSGVFEHNLKTEQIIYEWLDDESAKTAEERNDGMIVFPKPRNYQNVIERLISLYLSKKLYDGDGFKERVNKYGDQVFKWIIDLEGYDYDLFDCDWLLRCGNVILNNISNCELAKKSILAAYKKEYERFGNMGKIGDIIMTYVI